MATQTELMALGMPGPQAVAIGSSLNAAVAAAGSTQGTATALSADYNVITTGSGGVILPSAVGQSECVVQNTLGGNLTVYPAVGQTIYGGSNTAINNGFVVATNKTAIFNPVGVAWFANLSA